MNKRVSVSGDNNHVTKFNMALRRYAWNRTLLKVMFKKNEFKIGQTIQVKDGVKDVDFDVDMDGWHGRIVELKPNENLILIVFDSITLRSMPQDFIDYCEVEGLDWTEYYIGYDEVIPAAARDTRADVESVVNELTAKAGWAYLGKEGQAINAILADIDINDVRAQIAAWQDHLGETLTFPFKAVVDEWQHPRSSVKSGDRVHVLSLEDIDDSYGILVKVKRKFSTFIFPLCDLKALDEASSNYEPVYLYAVWYANR